MYPMRSCLKLLVLMTALLLAGVACGSGTQAVGSAGAADGGLTISITEPEDGADVAVPFTVRFSSSEELGPTESGKHHVHLFFDGNTEEYAVVESDSFEVTDLPPGQHTVGASLRNADHSPAGAQTEVTVNVTGSGGGAGSGEDDGDADPYGYGY